MNVFSFNSYERHFEKKHTKLVHIYYIYILYIYIYIYIYIVFVQIDKATGNITFVCKRFYVCVTHLQMM